MKKPILFFAALCCIISCLLPQKAHAQLKNPQWVNGVLYSEVVKNEVGEVYREREHSDYNYADLSGDVNIESVVPDIGVIKKIVADAFANKKRGGMINVTLPNTIEVIDLGAFYNATKLYSIRLNEGLKEMGGSVFYNCSALTEVYIPSTLKEIPDYTFYHCTSLPAIALSAGIEHIGSNAFCGCTALQTVKSQTGANHVKTIGERAFCDCSSLFDVRFSNGLTSIGKNAFHGCTKLENLTLPAKLASIGDFAFAYSGLKTLTVNMTTPININANVFTGVDLSQCTLYVPKGCKDAYKNADVWKKFGTILEIGEVPVEPITTGQQKIGGLWYDLHEDLTATLLKHDDNKNLSGAITIPASVTFGKYTYIVNDMENYVFASCSSITSVAVPNTITEIPSNTFRNCTGLTNVTMPSALTSIGQSAFYGCTALTFVSLPASLTEIEAYAFYGCDALTSVYIPAGIKTIKEYCFKSCDKLAMVSLPEGLTEIEQQAFIGCPALKTITLPASLTKLGDDLFSGEDMVSIRSLRETPPTATANTFRSMNKAACILYVPFETKSKYEVATGWKDFTNIQEKGVTETIKYGQLFYKLREDFTAWVTYETNGADNYKDLSGEITVEDKVIYQGAEYTVNEVGIDAFNGCTGITKVNLPLIMDEISHRAFKGCTNLAEVNIPSTLSFLMNTAFEDTKLFNDNKDADGAVYYDGCMLYYPLNAITGTYSVKEGTRLIATDVFEFDEKITELILPEGLQGICNGSVTTMYALKTLHLPSSLYYIGGDFCNDCFYLTTIYNYCTNPVDLSDNYCFDNVNQSKCTLYVPKGSRTAYESASVWQDFPLFEMKGVYTVTFEDYNGYTLKTESVSEGEDAHAPADPEREGYNFTGWDKTFTNVQADLTVTAQYQRKTFTVVFKDGETDGTIDSQNIEYGMSATEPEVPDHEDIGLVFAGWDYDFDIIMENTVVTALYDVATFTVTFLGYDDVELMQQIVKWDQAAITPGVPNVEGYTFKGWDTEYDHVKSDLTVRAVYEKMTFYVTFYDRKGGIIADREVAWDEAAEAPVPPKATGYHFVGWDIAFDHVRSDLEVHALYEINTYSVTVVADNGSFTVSPEETDLAKVEHGTVITLTAVPDEGYDFVKWTVTNHQVTVPSYPLMVMSDTTVTAVFQIKTFTVKFYDWDDQVISTQVVEWGKDAEAPVAPEVDGYTFTGWDTDFDYVTSDLTVRALYKESPATSLDAAEGTDSPAARKLLRNGILLIERNGKVYTSQGAEL